MGSLKIFPKWDLRSALTLSQNMSNFRRANHYPNPVSKIQWEHSLDPTTVAQKPGGSLALRDRKVENWDPGSHHDPPPPNSIPPGNVVWPAEDQTQGGGI